MLIEAKKGLVPGLRGRRGTSSRVLMVLPPWSIVSPTGVHTEVDNVRRGHPGHPGHHRCRSSRLCRRRHAPLPLPRPTADGQHRRPLLDSTHCCLCLLGRPRRSHRLHFNSINHRHSPAAMQCGSLRYLPLATQTSTSCPSSHLRSIDPRVRKLIVCYAGHLDQPILHTVHWVVVVRLLEDAAGGR